MDKSLIYKSLLLIDIIYMIFKPLIMINKSYIIIIDIIKGKKIIALSAIGNPASFEQTLCNSGAEVIESFRFPDPW